MPVVPDTQRVAVEGSQCNVGSGEVSTKLNLKSKLKEKRHGWGYGLSDKCKALGSIPSITKT
jgi:hypothetical protein